MKYCSRLDLNRTVQISGYYYDEDDIEKIHAHYKDGCIFIGDVNLNKPLILSLIRANSVEVLHDVQSLHTDKKRENMLTTWIHINDLIAILFRSIAAKDLVSNLREWAEKGVTEVYLSWYINSNELNNNYINVNVNSIELKIKERAIKSINKRLYIHKSRIDELDDYSERGTIHHLANMELTGAVICLYEMGVFNYEEYDNLCKQLQYITSRPSYSVSL